MSAWPNTWRVGLWVAIGLTARGVSAGSLYGQVRIGSAYLILGQSRDTTLQQLRALYNLELVDSSDGREAWNMRSKDGPPDHWVGSVLFRDNVLTNINKTWTPTNENNVDAIVGAIINALASLEGANAPCIVSSEKISESSFEKNDVQVECGNRTIVIATGKRQGDKFNLVFENWGMRNPTPAKPSKKTGPGR